MYSIIICGKTYSVGHHIKKRGEQTFSTLDTTMLPFFSQFRIIGKAFKDELDGKNQFTSHKLILQTLKKINTFFDKNYKITFLNDIPGLSYKIYYIDKLKEICPENIISETTYPYSGTIAMKGPKKEFAYNDEKLKDFLTNKMEIQSHTVENILPKIQDKTFTEKIFQTTHDFAYYCCQHSKGLYELNEPQIRDLFLVVIKTIFHYAEGEVFIFDGKLDYKITNPENEYEHIHGEFKWWNSESDLKKGFYQLIRKHTTGQEKEVYLLILNKNKDINKLHKKIIDLILEEEEIIEKLDIKLTPEGSKERFDEYIVNIKGNKVPLKTGIINLYYESV